MEQLFDIGKDNLEQLMRSDKITPRTPAAIEEDIFFIDQQIDRKWFISKSDEGLATIIEKPHERYKRQEQLRMKYLEEKQAEERCKSAPPPLDEIDEDLTPTKKRYKFGPANLDMDMFDPTLTDQEDSLEGSDDDFEYSAARVKTPKILPKGSMQDHKRRTDGSNYTYLC
ncbi:uncharacterized protein LOC124812049 [Hydra vulgaris]|uniref:uncharacterized protein LOC124812049 n=1 Tax=Hydra vulgaris TaxID=6087 RepID=UPI001F5E9D72|nr:uncharacterized protein LOC124812049 [Hydra vulgaris]